MGVFKKGGTVMPDNMTWGGLLKQLEVWEV